LSQKLYPIVDDSVRKGIQTVEINADVVAHFATASVEIWQRAIHSFLISSSLTQVSPMWASVAGYYSSHYSMRAIAHLIGFFQLFKKKKIAKIYISNGKYYCDINTKNGNDKEHKFYWNAVKAHPYFTDDPLFTFNEDNGNESDSGHRNIANYADHIGKYSVFRPLGEEELKSRIDFLSKIELLAVPIPRKNKYPDVESVQLVSYHRIVRFRRLLDECLGGSNMFWNTHRTPSWCAGYVSFQVTNPSFGERVQV